MNREHLQTLIGAIPPADAAAAQAAQARLDRLTKPKGSLGQIESLLIRLAAATGQVYPQIERRYVLLAAADHGVAAEGVSAYPQAVTGQMVLNFLSGGAAINVLAAAAGAQIVVVDAGVASELPDHPQLKRLDIRAGSHNIAREAAMNQAEALAAIGAGVEIGETLWKSGLDVLALGEMGIANTTPAAALTSAICVASPEQTVGRGTGVDDETLERKRHVVAQALQRAALTQHSDGLRLLCELGGLEIAVLAGATLGAAARRVPVLLDGYITTAAALVAARITPAVRPYLFASHCSAEPGHTLALDYLGLSTDKGAGPLLRLDLRLGEGSGAALALPILVSATRLMRNMATFAEAGVSTI
jgi:nicotinate-nucleotide--dimethylbenzimidazole phosphoribosyltransferase